MELDCRELQKLKELVPYETLAPTPDEIIKEIERYKNIIKNLDKMFEYYFLGNLKYDQDTVNAIYIKYIKLKELKEGK